MSNLLSEGGPAYPFLTSMWGYGLWIHAAAHEHDLMYGHRIYLGRAGSVQFVDISVGGSSERLEHVDEEVLLLERC